MKINGNNYNFGRVVQLVIGNIAGDPYAFNGEVQKLSNIVTIAFNPKENPQLNTRIDFIVRHQFGHISSITGAAYSLACIDIYNMGPALQQVLNAYNAADDQGYWLAERVTKKVCALQVGYHDGPLTTIFSGVINSYNVERKQNSSTVDTVWHLFAAGSGGYNIVPLSQEETATSGEDYTEYAKQQNLAAKTYSTGEDYIKAIVMARPRPVSNLVPASDLVSSETFSVIKAKQNISLVPLSQTAVITHVNFNKYFEIRYRAFNKGEDEEWTKEQWQQRPIKSKTIDTTNLAVALSEVARLRNCAAEIREDYGTGKQIIYIYSVNAKKENMQKKSDYIIVNYRNLRKPPQVSGIAIQFDMILEPSVRPNDTFELRVTSDFVDPTKRPQNTPSFAVGFSEGIDNWTTVFSGSNFEGLSNMITKKDKSDAVKQTGNVFNKKYVAQYIIHHGSTHTPEWSTQVECVSIERG